MEHLEIINICKIDVYKRQQEDFTNDALYQMLRGFADENGYKPGFVMWPVPVSYTHLDVYKRQP